MNTSQPGVLAPVPGHTRYLEFHSRLDTDVRPSLQRLRQAIDLDDCVVGFGPAVVRALEGDVEGLRPFPSLSATGCEIPSTQTDLWVWLRGEDCGALANRARSIGSALEEGFGLARLVDGFRYGPGLDLSGYVDGTENPVGEDAERAALLRSDDARLDCSTFVALQQWIHDLNHFDTLAQTEKDHIIGRRLSDNVELDDAPAFAHTNRTGASNFNPKSYIVRRSMPWADDSGEGLMFTAFGHTLDAFEVQLRRMAGHDDGVMDGLFRFTRPISGGYFWCPPVTDGALNLAALNL